MFEESRDDPAGHPYGWNWGKTEKVLQKGVTLLGLSSTQRQLEQFRIYYLELLKWNRVAALISKQDEHRFVTQHLLPSIIVLQFIPAHVLELTDVGSGAGLPGIPLKIMRPELKLTLIESKLKKALFLREIVDKLILSDVEVLHKRAEEVKSHWPLVVTRASGKLREAARICLPLLNLGGVLIVFKGSKRDREIQEAHSWIARFGGKLVEVKGVTFPITQKHGSLVFISKVSRET